MALHKPMTEPSAHTLCLTRQEERDKVEIEQSANREKKVDAEKDKAGKKGNKEKVEHDCVGKYIHLRTFVRSRTSELAIIQHCMFV